MLRTRILAPVARDVPPLTDDFAPVERYSRTFARYWQWFSCRWGSGVRKLTQVPDIIRFPS